MVTKVKSSDPSRVVGGRARCVVMESAVPGPQGELGYLLVASRSWDRAGDLGLQLAAARFCWLEERNGWWVPLQSLPVLTEVLDRHGLILHPWLSR